MNTNEETLYAGEQTINETNNSATAQQPVEEEKKNGGNAALRAAAIVGGAALGVGSAVAATKLFTSDEEQPEEQTEPEVAVAETNDDMSFDEAFNQARAQVGPGGAFRWHGGLYSTYTEEEWNNLSEEERNAYSARVQGIATGSEQDAETYQHSTPSTPQPDPNLHPASNNTPTHTEERTEFDVDTSTERTTTINGQEVIVAQGTYGGHQAAYIDSDLDGKYDLVIVDENDNGNLDDGDNVVDLNEEGISISVQDKSLIHVVDPDPTPEPEIGEPFETEIGGNKVVAAKVEMEGHQGYLIDVDRDGEYDAMVLDVNDDGQITPDEMIDISDQHITYSGVHVTPVNNDDSHQGVVITQEYVQEVDGKQVILAEGTVNGHHAAFVDYDGDGNYDRAIVDANDDGQIDDNEVYDLRGQGVAVQNRALVDTLSTDDPGTTDSNLDDPSDNLPDYVNGETEQGMTTDDTTVCDDPNSLGGDDTMGCDDTADVF